MLIWFCNLITPPYEFMSVRPTFSYYSFLFTFKATHIGFRDNENIYFFVINVI